MWMKHQPLRVLLDFVERCGHEVVLLGAVEMEVRAHVQRELRAAVDRIRSAQDRALRVGLIELPAFDSDAILEATLGAWDQAFNQVLKRYAVIQVPVDNTVLPEVLERATKRRPPCSKSGREVRDAVIWLSTLNYATACKMERLVFISANTSDFADDDKVKLRPELEIDVQRAGLNLDYHPSLESFNAEHSERFSHLTAQWVTANTDMQALHELIASELGWADPGLFRVIDSEDSDYYEVESVSAPHRLDITVDDPVMVWEANNSQQEVGIGLSLYAEMDADCVPTSQPDSRHHSWNPAYVGDYLPSSKTLPAYAELRCHAAGRVIGDSVQVTEILDFEPA